MKRPATIRNEHSPVAEILRGCSTNRAAIEKLAEHHADVAEWLWEEDQRMRAIERRIAQLERRLMEEARR